MFGNIMSIGFLFRCLNATLLSMGFSYYFYKRILPMLRAIVCKKEEEKQARLQAIQKFKNQEANIILAMQQQRTLGYHIELKIRVWQEVENNKAQDYKEEQERLAMMHQKRLERQQKELDAVYVLRQTVPSIIAQAETDIKENLTLPGHEAYIQNLINFLARKQDG